MEFCRINLCDILLPKLPHKPSVGFCPHCTDLALLGCSSCIMAYYCQNTLRIQIMQVEQPWKLFLGTRGLWPTIWCLLNSTSLSFVILYLGPILPRRAMFSDYSRCVLYFKNTEKRQGHNEIKVTVNLSDLIAPSTFFKTSSMWNLCPLRLNLSLKTWQMTFRGGFGHHVVWFGFFVKTHPNAEADEQTRCTLGLVSEDTFQREVLIS